MVASLLNINFFTRNQSFTAFLSFTLHFTKKRASFQHFATTVELVYFVTFSSVPAEFLSFVYISVRLIRHRLIRQFA